MGYGYGYSSNGRQALACDSCGRSEGDTRKRTCPRTVLTDSTRSAGRQRISYCYPPALCPNCWVKEGRTAGVHGDCAQAAAKSTARYDQIEARFRRGDGYVVSAAGSWADDVPDGSVKVTFSFATEHEPAWRDYLVPAGVYDPSERKWLSEYPDAVELGERTTR
jgi:hypothetical protein